MTQAIDIIANNPLVARKAIEDGWMLAKALTIAERKVRISVAEAEDDRSLQQLRFYWGACLREISEQAVINGQRWAAEAWHELAKRQFLGYEIKKVHVAGKKRPVVIRRLRSTTGLKVKAMGNYLDQLQAWAATDLGVRFSVSKWQEYQS